MAAPIPDDAPVMSATLPLNDFIQRLYRFAKVRAGAPVRGATPSLAGARARTTMPRTANLFIRRGAIYNLRMSFDIEKTLGLCAKIARLAETVSIWDNI